jgi:hypothetical protein
MLALIEININILYLAAIIFVSVSIGFLINRKQFHKQKSAISRLEVEMLHSHTEILQLQKELSEKDNARSKTPIFSIKDAPAESSQEQGPVSRLSKKIVGGGKTTS